jgi:hypothetical protein
MKALVLLLFGLSTAHAGPVKTYSGLVGDPEPMQGSGLYFTRKVEGKLRAFVVTSDHVVYHGNQIGKTEYDHIIQFPGLRTRAWAKFLVAEEGNGLALLEVLSGSGGWRIPGEDPFPETRAARVDEQITPSGFPFGSQSLLNSNYGIVDSTPGHFAAFPLDFPMVEIVHAIGEYGMSGGPAWAQEGEFLGILAHQVIHTDGKGGSRAVEWRAGEKIENHLIAVSGPVVKAWVDEYFADPKSYRPYYESSALNQSQGSYFYTGNLSVGVICNYDNVTEALKGKCQIELGLHQAEGTAPPKYQLPYFAKIEAWLRTRPDVSDLHIMGFRSNVGSLQVPANFSEFLRLVGRTEAGLAEPLGTMTYKRQDYESRQRDEKDLETALKSAEWALGGDARQLREIHDRIMSDRYDRPIDWLVKPSDITPLISAAKTDDTRQKLQALQDALAKLYY